MSAGGYDPWAEALEKHAAWEKRSRRLRRLRTVAAILAVVVTLGAVSVLGIGYLRSVNTERAAARAADASSAAPSTASAAAAVSGPAPGDPFAGTPAEDFAAGPDGLALPAAAPLGRFTAADVEEALRATKDFIVASHLDPRAFAGDREPAYALLADSARRQVREWIGGTPPDPSRVSTYFTHFAPDVTLVGTDARVNGTLSAELDPDDGEAIVIRANHVFAYPLRRGDTSTVVIVHRKADYAFYPPRVAYPAESGLFPASGEGSVFWDVDCDAQDQGLLAPGRITTGTDSDIDYEDRFKLDEPITGVERC